MHESMGNDWMPAHYTMKTSASQRPSPGPRSSHARNHSRTGSFSKRSAKSPSSSTPVASPRMPYSVGQMHPPPPRLSPGRPADARSPSPNYFGMMPEADGNSRESSNLPRDHWDPPTSSLRSFGEVLPQHMPIEANPDYEAFRKQVEQTRGTSGFNLPTSQQSPAITQTTSLRPRPPPRWHTHGSEGMSVHNAAHRPALNRNKSGSHMEIDQDTTQDSAYVSSDSKRNSEASMQPPAKPPMFLNMPTFESPRLSASPFDQKAALSKLDERHPRLSVPQGMADATFSQPPQGFHPKSETLPVKMEGGPSMIPPSQLQELIESRESDTDLLLLDLRVSQQYLQARVEGALNLCTPTTLLKRATFNLQRLQQTFSNPNDKAQFSMWASTHNLVVYDSHSVEKRDALPCVNMVKKFTNEGYKGNTFILRGGFNAFYDAYPELVDEGWAAGSDGTSQSTDPADGPRAGLPPVIGGVMLPAASNEPNPFFSNIRQNMDLADGVGQLDVSRPKGLDSPSLPHWLRDASTAKDEGKKVSEKFLAIEKDEQSRMKEAYAMFKPTANPPKGCKPVQLCGVEKGGKNRYKDILPFEHARVKLQGRPRESCDYVNASHIKASGSNKRYIASQGPLPTTFEDFWSMIWDQDVRVIVMLTAESEGGTLKCHPYWKGRDFGPIRLKPLSEKKVSLDMEKHHSHSQASMFSPASASESGRKRANTTTTLGGSGDSPAPQPVQSQSESHVIIRKFALSHASQPFAPIREITHLHYPSWPDFGAPAQPSHLLALVELSNVMQRASLPVDTPSIAASRSSPDPGPAWYDEPESGSRARPMLVHCSAGCGRTGTFCTVDSVIDMLKRQRLARTTLKPVRKRDSDGDIKMSGEREVEEPISPRTAQDRAFAISESPPNRPSSVSSNRRVPSWDGGPSPPLDTSWVGDDGIDLVAKTVEDFRTQRLSMVQSLRQFVLCYESILEYIARTHERSSANVSTSTGRARSGSLQVRREG